MESTQEMTGRSPRISSKSVERLYLIRQQKLTERQRFETIWREIAAKVNPMMADWNEKPGQTAINYKELYDQTAMKASARLGDGIQAHGFSRINPWLRLASEEEDLMERSEVLDWLQLREIWALRQFSKSTFYDEGRIFVRSGADFGTGCMMRSFDPKRGTPSYQTLHLKRVLILENPWGEVDTLFRDLWLSADDAAALFGAERLPQQVKDARTRGDQGLFLFQQFIFPLDRFDLDLSARETRGMPFYSLYASALDKQPLREGGFQRKPFFVWRWTRSLDGDVWATECPGMYELANVKQLNGMRKDYSQMSQLAARPPLKATEGTRGKIKFVPNGITYLQPGEDFTAAAITGNIKAVQEDLAVMKQEIGESYYTDLFLALTRNIEAIKTATLAQGIEGEQAALLTAIYGRLGAEFLEPVVEDIVQMGIETGQVPPPPPVMRGRTVKVDLISNLAQLQKRYFLLDTTRQWLNELLVIAQIQAKAAQEPDVLDNIDLNEYARVTQEMYHVDRRVVRDLLDVQRMRAARARDRQAILAAQMQNEALQGRSKAYEAMAKAPEPGSPAEAMMASGEAEGQA